ncbi:PTS glucitol/sorbitol transporter subunit IIB [Enterococcus xiangfangensis]|uniref:PTS glucitol/sorbitol transporter subunit IIB n=1 Tax=Enterococcus xiangfangensis TaxID=1296537 RepID=UPI0010F45910|nr:PTS glucitol/sorbitol transporter subunit IIB [Enterococcus xiangfangensis]MBM7712021.1 PTS system glucitol/sorbitol-specific IIC component [Enterococcus xiangfangensis]NBK08015.1 PTS glucitol/sorbitol IIBC subunit [Enterococcus asini]
MYKTVFVKPGNKGWGVGLKLTPTDKKNKVVSVTGGGIHPVAQQIADLTGGIACDGFKNAIPEDEMLCAIIDCGGTARIGVYPMKRIPTVDVLSSSPSGPLSKHITEDIFVSGVRPEDVSQIEDANLEDQQIAAINHAHAEDAESAAATEKMLAEGRETEEEFRERYSKIKEEHQEEQAKKDSFLVRFSRGIGGVMSTFYQSGRDALDMLLKNIIPFMAFISMIVGIINYTGIGDWLANVLSPLAGSLPGMIILALICSIPILSPILGPGAVISQVIGVLIGTQIANGSIPVQYALPALFAINAHVGCDFIPVGLSLGEAKPETVAIGVPAILYGRMLTGFTAVILAWLASFGMY